MNWSQDFNLMWFLYLISGGIYFIPNVKTLYTTIYVFFSSSSLVIILIGGIGYFLTVKSPSFLDIIYGSSVMIGSSIMSSVIPLILYTYRQEFIVIFKYIYDCMNHTINYNQFPGTKKPQINIRYKLKWWFIIRHFISHFLYIGIPFIDFLFLSEQEYSYRNSEYHVIAMPFVDCLPSKTVFIVLYLTESIAVTYPIQVGMAVAHLILIISYMLHNIICMYCNEMEYLSKLIHDEAKLEIFGKFTSSDHLQTRSVSTSKIKTKGRCFREIDGIQIRLIQLIQQYQEFLRITIQFFSIVNKLGTIMLIAIIGAQLPLIFIFLNPNLGISMKGKCISLAFVIYVYFYAFCEVGTLFDDMNEDMFLQIYSLPWYYLTTNTRVLIYIWRSQLLKTPPLKGLKIYPLNRQFFPSVLSTVYSIANVLRKSI